MKLTLRLLSLLVSLLSLLGVASSASAQARAYRVEVRGPIDASTQSHLHRGLTLAEEAGALLVLDIDTPGGGVEVTWQIARSLQQASDRGVPTIAWVNERATSAGAMLSMACDTLYMRPTGTIGSALPVTIGPTGMQPVSPDESVREKTLSYCREEFRVIAEKSGRSGLLAEAMVDPDVGVVAIELEGERKLVSEREYDDMRMEGVHPRFLRTVVEEGKLLNVGGEEALDLGLCDGLVDSVDELAASLGVTPDELIPVERTRSEDWASVLYAWSPLLLVLGFLCAYVEFKMPGFGLPGILSIACFALVVFGRFLVGLADVPHVVLLVIGVGLIATELFLVPGTIWFGALGVVALLAGIVWSFAGLGTGFEYGLDRSILLDESLRVLIAATIAMVATWSLSRFLPKTPFFGRVVLDPLADGTGTAQAAAMADAGGRHAELARVGSRGRALTALRPVGKVTLVADETLDYEALSSGPEIAPGTAVVVVEVQGSGRLVVEEERA